MKSSFYKTPIILFLFFIPITINAQEKPYLAPMATTKINTTSLKKQVSLIRKDICGNRINDTLFINFYNKKGQENKSLRYYKNKLEYYTNTTFDNNNNPLKHDTFHSDQRRGNSIITIKYKNNKEIGVGNYDLNTKKDTISKNESIKQYNKNGDLVEETTTTGLLMKYKYNKKNQKTEYSTGTKNLARTDKTFYYYENDLIVRTASYSYILSKPQDSTLTSTQVLKYNNKKLLTEESFKISYYKDENINIYEYNDNNQLIKMSLKKGSDFMNVEYQYSKNKISKQIIQANTMYGFSVEVFIPLSNCYLTKNQEFNYEADYFYDDKNNLIKIDRYLDNDLKTSTEYLLEYY